MEDLIIGKKMKAIWWDGSFKQAYKISLLLEGIEHSTMEGKLSYINKKGKIVSIPKNTYVVRDEGEIKYYYQTGDSLLENEFTIHK